MIIQAEHKKYLVDDDSATHPTTIAPIHKRLIGTRRHHHVRLTQPILSFQLLPQRLQEWRVPLVQTVPVHVVVHDRLGRRLVGRGGRTPVDDALGEGVDSVGIGGPFGGVLADELFH